MRYYLTNVKILIRFLQFQAFGQARSDIYCIPIKYCYCYWFWIFWNSTSKSKLRFFWIKKVLKTPYLEDQYTNNNKYWFSKIIKTSYLYWRNVQQLFINEFWKKKKTIWPIFTNICYWCSKMIDFIKMKIFL
jgi:hypothetical protein